MLDDTAIIFGTIMIGFLIAVWWGLRGTEKKESTPPS